jgi:type IV pilus assembly protein PilF
MDRLLKVRFLTLMLLGLLLLTSCASKTETKKSREIELYFGAGTQALMDKDYTEALRNLLKANELSPNNSEILNNLGMAYYFKGEKELALKTLNRALKINQKNSDARTNLASIYYSEGNYSAAEMEYKKVLKDLTYQKQARTYFNLGLLELNVRKNVKAAENYFQKSVKEDENYCPAYHHLGLIQYARREFSNAFTSFKEATLGVCYEFPAPHFYQALTLIELNRIDEARMKLVEVDTRFKKSIYSEEARAKNAELNSIEKKKAFESHASRNVLETPEF